MSRLIKAAVITLTVLFAGVTVAPLDVASAHPATTVSPKKSKGVRGASAKGAPKTAKKLSASASALAKKKNAKKAELALIRHLAKKYGLVVKTARPKKTLKKPTPKIPAKAPPKKGP